MGAPLRIDSAKEPASFYKDGSPAMGIRRHRRPISSPNAGDVRRLFPIVNKGNYQEEVSRRFTNLLTTRMISKTRMGSFTIPVRSHKVQPSRTARSTVFYKDGSPVKGIRRRRRFISSPNAGDVRRLLPATGNGSIIRRDRHTATVRRTNQFSVRSGINPLTPGLYPVDSAYPDRKDPSSDTE